MKAKKELGNIYTASLILSIILMLLTHELEQGVGWALGWCLAGFVSFAKCIQWGAFDD